MNVTGGINISSRSNLGSQTAGQTMTVGGPLTASGQARLYNVAFGGAINITNNTSMSVYGGLSATSLSVTTSGYGSGGVINLGTYAGLTPSSALTGASPSVNVTFSGNTAKASCDLYYAAATVGLAFGSTTGAININGGAYEGDVGLSANVTGTAGFTLSSTGTTGLEMLRLGYANNQWGTAFNGSGLSGTVQVNSNVRLASGCRPRAATSPTR